MKLTSLIVLVTALTAATVFGQGTTAFKNYGSGANGTIAAADRGYVYGPDGVTKLSGTGYTAELWGGANAGALAALAQTHFGTGNFVGLYAPVITVAVPGVAGGGDAWFQVRAWDNAGGTINTYATALTRGDSGNAFKITLADATNPNQPVLIGQAAFTIRLVPEPSTLALAGLGLASLLIFRRRK